MNREIHVRFCEQPMGRFRWLTDQIENITAKQEKALKMVAKNLLSHTDAHITSAIKNGLLYEVKKNEKEAK